MIYPIKTFVINLDRSIENYNHQRPYLESLGLDVYRFQAIDGSKDEHLQYRHIVDTIYYELVPKNIISASLSHTLVCKYIQSLIQNGNTDPYFLILEDDAYPLYNKQQFHKNVENTIRDIHTIDNEWDIIALHIDGPCSDFLNTCKENYLISLTSGSLAAYIISRNGVIKLANETIFWYPDVMTSINSKYKKYKSKKNLFWTDEKNSNSRENVDTQYIEKILNNFIILKGEKTWNHLLNYKALRIPIIKKDVTYYNMFLFVCVIIILFIILFYRKYNYL